MSRRLLYCLLILSVCLCSCKKGDQVIPRKKMAKIYAEMFVADQKLADEPRSVRNVADTSFVYEPIFEKYGYTSDDYRASLAYYIQDANRFARILKESVSIIEGDIKDLKKQKALLALLEGSESKESQYAPMKIYYMTGIGNPRTPWRDSLRFMVDSTGGELLFDSRQWADTAYYGPMIVLKGERRPAKETYIPASEDLNSGNEKSVGRKSGNVKAEEEKTEAEGKNVEIKPAQRGKSGQSGRIVPKKPVDTSSQAPDSSDKK